MKIFRIAWKTLLEGWREPQLFGLLLAFPAALILIYFFAFGQTSQAISQLLRLLVIDEDHGPASAELIDAIQNTRFENAPVFKVDFPTDRATAETIVSEQKAALILVIPDGFSQKIDAARRGEPLSTPPVITQIGDPASFNYIFSSSFLAEIFDGFAKQAIGWEPTQTITVEFLPNTGTMTDFQFGVPGILVFGILFGIISSATVLVREESRGTLQRLRLSQLHAVDILLGITLAHLVLAVIQLPMCFLVAVLCGFKSPGSLILATGIGVLLSLSSTGLGLAAASLSHSEGEATAIATSFMVPVVFLSGAIFPMPPLKFASIAGKTIRFTDILPASPASEALRRVLVYGDPPSAIVYELIVLVLLAALYLGAGIWLYQRRLNRANG